MAQHSLAFTDILQKNIRHVYSGRPSHMSFRQNPPPRDIPIIELPRRIDEQQRRPPDRFRHKFEEYMPEYDISLPRAPAFSTLKGPEVDLMVKRLSRPSRRENRYDMASRTALSKKVSPEEMETIITRLIRPTKSSMVRIMMRRPNAESRYTVKSCSAQDRLTNPDGMEDCCVPCRIIRQTNRPRISEMIMQLE